jgi:response regulator RpfG family c-di-GMP phosphodiesterase
MDNKIQILYIDEEEHNLNAFRAWFRVTRKYIIHTALPGEEALKVLSTIPIDVLIVDQEKENKTGVEFLKEKGVINPNPVKIVLSAHRNTNLIETAEYEGKIYKCHFKPLDLNELSRSIEEGYRRLLKKRAAIRKNE